VASPAEWFQVRLAGGRWSDHRAFGFQHGHWDIAGAAPETTQVTARCDEVTDGGADRARGPRPAQVVTNACVHGQQRPSEAPQRTDAPYGPDEQTILRRAERPIRTSRCRWHRTSFFTAAIPSAMSRRSRGSIGCAFPRHLPRAARRVADDSGAQLSGQIAEQMLPGGGAVGERASRLGFAWGIAPAGGTFAQLQAAGRCCWGGEGQSDVPLVATPCGIVPGAD
jgi:hypothetical protein